MKSIQRQLILPLLAGVFLLQVAGGLGLFAYVHEALEHSLDASLLTKANAIADAVHVEDDGLPHLQGSTAALSASAHRDSPFYFEIWRGDGTPLAGFGPEPLHLPPHLPIANRHRWFADIHLSNGIHARATAMTFEAQADEDEDEPRHSQSIAPGQPLTLVVAHDRSAIDQSLDVLLSGLAIMTLLVLGGIAGIVGWSVRRGLRPLNDLADAVSKIEPATLDRRCESLLLPLEIQPVAQKLNELLGRLEEAFQRERRFAADVAHELRTPIAELRSSCEVALRWPDPNGLRAVVAESLAISQQMDQTVATLLSLVRVQAAIDLPVQDQFDLAALVLELTNELKSAVAAKSLEMNLHMPGACLVRTDLPMLTQALRNLLGNAVQHAPQHGSIRIDLCRTDLQAVLGIQNTCYSLQAADLPHLREPFWRKDSARSDRDSTGLGLAIADEYCRAMGLTLELGLPRAELFRSAVIFSQSQIAPLPQLQPSAFAEPIHRASFDPVFDGS